MRELTERFREPMNTTKKEAGIILDSHDAKESRKSRSTRNFHSIRSMSLSSSRRSTRVSRSSQPSVKQRSVKSSNKKAWLLATVFAVVGIGLLAYQPVMNYIIGPMQLNKAYAKANTLSAEDIQANAERLSQEELDKLFDYDSVRTITTLEVSPVINTQNVVGGIYVPSVNMMMPIMYGVSQDVLKNSAGTMKPEQRMGKGNYAIIGHNSRNKNALFAPIRRINKGDSMYITDKNKVYEYKMTAKKVVQPTDIHVIDDVEGKTILTLLSCNKDGTKRVVVQGELVNEFDYADASKELLKAFNDL